MSTTDVLRSDLTEGSSLTIKDIEEELEIHANRFTKRRSNWAVLGTLLLHLHSKREIYLFKNDIIIPVNREVRK